MPLPTGSTVLVTYRSLFAQQRVLLTLTYTVTGDQGTGSPWERSNELATVLANPVDPVLDQYRRCLGANVSIKEVRVQVIHPVRYQYGSHTVGLPGLSGANATTGNIATALTFHTGVAGRGEIANKHIGPPPTDVYVDGAPTLAYSDTLSTLGSLIAQRFSQMVGTGLVEMESSIFHKATGQHSPIVTWTVADRIGTLRRRTLRVGE